MQRASSHLTRPMRPSPFSNTLLPLNQRRMKFHRSGVLKRRTGMDFPGPLSSQRNLTSRAQLDTLLVEDAASDQTPPQRSYAAEEHQKVN